MKPDPPHAAPPGEKPRVQREKVTVSCAGGCGRRAVTTQARTMRTPIIPAGWWSTKGKLWCPACFSRGRHEADHV